MNPGLAGEIEMARQGVAVDRVTATARAICDELRRIEDALRLVLGDVPVLELIAGVRLDVEVMRRAATEGAS